jgi:hypothetical protein
MSALLPKADIAGRQLNVRGMFEMIPVRLSWRRTYINFTDAMADAMSAQRHIDKLNAPIAVTYGTLETPDFQRQSRDFAAAVKAVTCSPRPRRPGVSSLAVLTMLRRGRTNKPRCSIRAMLPRVAAGPLRLRRPAY